MAHQKVESWKGQGRMQKREEQDGVTSEMEENFSASQNRVN